MLLQYVVPAFIYCLTIDSLSGNDLKIVNTELRFLVKEILYLHPRIYLFYLKKRDGSLLQKGPTVAWEQSITEPDGNLKKPDLEVVKGDHVQIINITVVFQNRNSTPKAAIRNEQLQKHCTSVAASPQQDDRRSHPFGCSESTLLAFKNIELTSCRIYKDITFLPCGSP